MQDIEQETSLATRISYIPQEKKINLKCSKSKAGRLLVQDAKLSHLLYRVSIRKRKQTTVERFKQPAYKQSDKKKTCKQEVINGI